MIEYWELFKDWPTWAGSVPMWGVFIMLLIAMVRTSPDWFKTFMEARAAKWSRHDAELRRLDAEIIKCRKDCDAETAELRKIIGGMDRQRKSQQRAVIRAIMSTVSDPGIKRQLEMLESVQFVEDDAVYEVPASAPQTAEAEAAEETLIDARRAERSAEKTVRRINDREHNEGVEDNEVDDERA